MDKFFHDIKNNIPAPDQAWLEQTKSFVLSQYELKHSQVKVGKIKNWYRKFNDNFSVTRQLALRPMAVTAVLLAIVFGGPLSTVLASQSALPGDNLYQVKKVVKTFKRYLTITNIKQAEREIAFVGGSVSDLTRTINKTESVEDTRDKKEVDNIQLAIEAVKKDVESLQKNLETQNNSQNPRGKEKAVALARLVTQQKTKINQELFETKQKLTNSIKKEVTQTIEEVEAQLAHAGRVAVTVLAQEHEGDQTQEVILKEELALLVNQEISDTKDKINILDEKDNITDDLKGLIEAQTQDVKNTLFNAEELADSGNFYMAMMSVEEASQKIETVKDIIKKVTGLSEDIIEDTEYPINQDDELADQKVDTQEDPGETKGDQDVLLDQNKVGGQEVDPGENVTDIINNQEVDGSDHIEQSAPNKPLPTVEVNNNAQEAIDQEYKVKIGE